MYYVALREIPIFRVGKQYHVQILKFKLYINSNCKTTLPDTIITVWDQFLSANACFIGNRYQKLQKTGNFKIFLANFKNFQDLNIKYLTDSQHWNCEN